ncbi:MAG: choice-of-anchor L domain-containing protein, partial [Thermoanaerobaculia bacterium]
MSGRSWVCVFAIVLLAFPAFAVTTKSIDDGLTALEVAAVLTGSGAVISNVRITGSDLAIGSFDDGSTLGFDAGGVILSTGDIADAVGPNTITNKGKGLGTSGHPALDQIVKPFTTNDAAVLEFDVVTESPTFAIRYVFASEEYREWVDSEFNDVFGFFVNGANIAVTPGTASPVTINTINHLRNQGLYRDNETGVATQFDGYTVPLLAVAVVEPGTVNHIRIAIADTSDSALDSAVFIARGGISGSQIAPIIVPEVSAIEARLGDANGTTIALPLYFAFENAPPTLTATGVPGATVTFSPMYRGADGRLFTDMKIVLGPDTPSGTHVLTIRSSIGEAESFATLLV